MTKVQKTSLPVGITTADLKYPEYSSGERIARDAGDGGTLMFYETTSFGWCLATLEIARARRGTHRINRTYAARVSDGATVRIGMGPHVTRSITVYVRESRREALKKYIDMFVGGQQRANAVRDRISSRRAEGAERRARGETYWRWTV